MEHDAYEIATTRAFRGTLAAAFPEAGVGEGPRRIPTTCFAARAAPVGSARRGALEAAVAAMATEARMRAWEIERRRRRDPAFADVWEIEQEDWNVFLAVLRELMEERKDGDGEQP